MTAGEPDGRKLFVADLRKALTAVWILLSAVLFLAAISPWLLPAETLQSLFPVCEARRRGAACVLCGMTTAYIRIGAGDLGAALDANAGSLWLWGASVANFALAKAYIFMLLLRSPKGAAQCS